MWRRELAELAPEKLLSPPEDLLTTCYFSCLPALPLPCHHAFLPRKLSVCKKGGGSPREGEKTTTFQHADMHGVISFLWDTEHHLQAILEFPFSFFTAS